MLMRLKISILSVITLCFTQLVLAVEFKTDVIKSPNDQREYAYLTLENNLDVMLISDKESDKAAASLDIHVGSSDDPIEYPGLAHFLEHMLFLGTAKYPEPDAYQKFISEHGGGHNAYTSLQNTNYFFDVNADYLEEALDRFSQQFTAPLFNKEYVQREVNAVHSEYSSKIQDDGRRYLESLKTTLAPNHPYKRFAVGNLETLVDKEDKSLRSALLDFYDDEYSANRMKLTVLGKEDLSTLAEWVEVRFSKIPNKNLPVKQITEPFFSGGYLPAKLQVESVMDTRSLSLSFPIPSTKDYIHSQPMGYLANLIGHEGKGSLLSALKDKQLVDTLSAGTQFDTGVHAMFIITMSLTETGLKNQDEIMETVFGYIELLNQRGISKLYFDEQAKLSEIGFKFKEKAPALSYVRSLSSSLHDFEPNEVLSAFYQLNDFNPELIEEYLSYLKPENLLVSLKAQDLKTDNETTWFKAPYAVNPLSISLTNKLKKAAPGKDLALPEPNAFIPDNTDLLASESDPIPKRFDAAEGIELWHATDTEFGTPKSTFFLSVRSPYAMDSVEHMVMTQLLVSMLIDNLVEYSYPAYLAGLSYDLYKHMRGVTVKIAGYNDKQDVLLETILKNLKTSPLRELRFDNIKERLKRSLENEKEQKPFQQAIKSLQESILVPSWSSEEKLVALKAINIEQLRSFKDLFFSTIDTAILSNGNVDKEQTLQMAALVKEHLLSDANIQKVERAQVVDLEGDQDWGKSLSIDHPDTSMVFYMQGESKEYSERALYGVLSQAISNDYYGQLRTEKQLGYIVFATPFPMLEIPGIAFIIQSPSTPASKLFDETINFMEAEKSRIDELSDTDFERYKKAVISRLEEKETNIGQRSNRYWSEIDKQNYSFDSKQKLIDAVTALELDTFKEFYSKRASKKGANLVIVSGHKETAGADEKEPVLLDTLLTQKERSMSALSTFPN